MHSLEERSGLLMQMNSRTEGRRDRIQFLDKRVLIPFRGTHWQVDGEGRLCVGEELVLPPLMGRGGAMPSNISSPRYLPALVVSLVNWVINAIISSSHFRRKPLQETELDRRLRPLGVRELSGDVERDR